MSEPIKRLPGLPSDRVLKQWAEDYPNSEHKGYVGAMAFEVVRLRAELTKASAEVQRLESERGQFGPCSDGWTYSIGSIAWGKTIESPSRVSLSRKHVDGRREELFDFVPQQGSSPVVKMGGIVAKAGDEIVGSMPQVLRKDSPYRFVGMPKTIDRIGLPKDIARMVRLGEISIKAVSEEE